MMNDVTIDGKSGRDFGLYFDKLPLFPMAEQLTEEYNVGADETSVYKLDQYAPMQIQLEAYTKDPGNILNVYKWLSDAKTIILSTQPSIYGKIKSVGNIAPVREGWHPQKISVPLTLSPFKYAVDSPEETIQNGDVIVNHGTVFSRPVWKLYNITSPVTLRVNGSPLKINISGGADVIIDVTRMVAYSHSTTEKILPKTTGQLPMLAAGFNKIEWTGGVETVTIQKNERWL